MIVLKHKKSKELHIVADYNISYSWIMRDFEYKGTVELPRYIITRVQYRKDSINDFLKKHKKFLKIAQEEVKKREEAIKELNKIKKKYS